MAARRWIEDFALKHFDSSSIFVYTDYNRDTGWVGRGDAPAGGNITNQAPQSTLDPEYGRFYRPLGEFDKTTVWEGEGFEPTAHRDRVAHVDET